MAAIRFGHLVTAVTLRSRLDISDRSVTAVGKAANGVHFSARYLPTFPELLTAQLWPSLRLKFYAETH